MHDFSNLLISWQKIYGRHDFPWQNTKDPYAIWVSEIMLQQTQVSAVIGYYSRFMQRFPTISQLAQADQEEVLQYWSGLGYYSRARNLHNAAKAIMEFHSGVFPTEFNTVQTLSGIGRSTAAAIVSFAFGQRQTILDGNVKRVLARHFAIVGWPGTPVVSKQMWLLAETLLPQSDMIAYTQGLMDLGATICTRSKPKCNQCPVQASCKGYEQGLTKQLPTSKPKKTIPQKETAMLVFVRDGKVLLEKRPQKGIWAGLWSFPELDVHEDVEAFAKKHVNSTATNIQTLPTLNHVFSHYKLLITPQVLKLASEDTAIGTWFTFEKAMGAAIPAPILTILKAL
jgi:A/G-specific adenine glycosylase